MTGSCSSLVDLIHQQVISCFDNTFTPLTPPLDQSQSIHPNTYHETLTTKHETSATGLLYTLCTRPLHTSAGEHSKDTFGALQTNLRSLHDKVHPYRYNSHDLS